MTRKQLLHKVKEEQKVIAREIRQLKSSRKQDKRNGRALWSIEADIWKRKFRYRHTHIAYCEFRGRTREQIERPREDNLPVQQEIDKIMENWASQIETNVCASAAGSH